MRTPAGKDCSYFYGNYFRGANFEECRLIGNASPPNDWRRELCKTCPVPDIQRANSCEFMTLSGEVMTSIFGIIRRMKITANCSKKGGRVEDPMIGCGICHPLPPFHISE